jgi:hypothetical protein
MKTWFIGLLSLLPVSNALAFPLDAPAAPAAADPAIAYDFEGIVALSNCSGSLVRFTFSLPGDAAMVLTNGHCLGGFIPPGQAIVDRAVIRRMSLLTRDGQSVAGRVDAVRVLYATMTGTDLTLYRLKQTYADIEAEAGVRPLTIADRYGKPGEGIQVISGYWRRGYSCAIDYFVPTLKEDQWSFHESIRYTRPGCETIGGTSGSPILSAETREIIGINNTGNESGQQCTMDNPCEVDAEGKILAEKGVSYGQQTSWIYGCLNAAHEVDVNVAGCRLTH